MNPALEKIASVLKAAERVLIVTHVYPDGDALGSQLALGNIMEELGKVVVLFGEEKVSHLYDFLPGSGRIATDPPDGRRFDCIVALDCGDALRLGREMDRLLEIHPFVVIDHHAGHKDFGDLRWVDSQRGSTGEMVFDLAQAMGAKISYDAAFCLYTAIVSDTGSFKYASTTARTLQVAAELIGKGVEPAKVAGRLYDNFTISRLELLKHVLDTLQIHGNGLLAMIHVTRQMFEKTGAVEEETENFINYPRSLASVKIAAFLKEAKDGRVSVSLRSKGKQHDVASVARQFGGGGHRNAAGFKLTGTTLEEVRQRLLDALLPLATGN